MERVYLALFVVGAAVPLSRFLPWLFDHGLDVSRFFDELFANRISGFFGLDVFIAVPVLWLAALTDRGLRAQQRWLLIGGAAIGASAGIPLYLYFRERNAAEAPPVSQRSAIAR
jgi:hypothetical protein